MESGRTEAGSSHGESASGASGDIPTKRNRVAALRSRQLPESQALLGDQFRRHAYSIDSSIPCLEPFGGDLSTSMGGDGTLFSPLRVLALSIQASGRLL